MPMLDANDPAFQRQYPNWAKVYDAWGRELRHVKACNPETGEVISYGMGWIAKALHGLLWARDPRSFQVIWRPRILLPWARPSRSGLIAGDHELLRRHGFWPAQLRVVANMPRVKAETPT